MDETSNFERFYATTGPDGTEPVVSFDTPYVRGDRAGENDDYTPPIDEQHTQLCRPVPDVAPIKNNVTHKDGSEWEVSTHPATGEIMDARLVKRAPDVRMLYEDRGGNVTFSTSVDRRRSPAAAHALHAAAQHLIGGRNGTPSYAPYQLPLGAPMYPYSMQPTMIPGFSPAAPSVPAASAVDMGKKEGGTLFDDAPARKRSGGEGQRDETGVAARLVPKIIKRGLGVILLTYAMDFIGYNAVSFVSHPTHFTNITGNIRVSKNPFIGFEDMGKIIG